MELICCRDWGQPKLVKPKFCNNKTLLGTVNFIANCKCKVWCYNNEYYILHRDWFSRFISYDEAVAHGLVKQYNCKFIYNDNFGGVVLRNEAIIKFAREDWYYPTPSMSTNMCLSLEKMLDEKPYSLANNVWESFFERCLQLITSNNFDTGQQWVEPVLRSVI